MENNYNKYDDLDNLFRSRLNEDKPAESNWNVPPDSLFEDVQNKLSSNNKNNRKAIIIWILAGILILSIGGLQLYTSVKLDRLEKSLEGKDQFQHPSDYASDIKATEIDINNDKTNELLSETKINNSINSSGITNNSGIKETKQSVTDNQAIIDQSLQKSPDQDSDALFTKQIPDPFNLNAKTKIEDTGENDNQLNIVKSERQIDRLEILENAITAIEEVPVLNYQELSFQRDRISMFLENATVFDKYSEERKTELYIFSAFTLSSFKMTNTEQNQFSLTKYDKNYLGYQFGLGLKFKLLNNLKLNSSFAWSQFKNESIFKDEMAYDPSNESINSDGDKMYNADMNVESPTGSYAAQVRFSVSDQDLTEDDFLQNNTETEQRFNSLRLTLGIDYTFLKAKKFEWLFSGGLSGNYIFGLTQDMNTKLSFEDQVLMDKSFSSKSMDEMNLYFISIYGNVGVKYNLTDQLHLQLSGGWENALSPVRTTNTTVPSKTYLNHFKSQLNLAYRF